MDENDEGLKDTFEDVVSAFFSPPPLVVETALSNFWQSNLVKEEVNSNSAKVVWWSSFKNSSGFKVYGLTCKDICRFRDAPHHADQSVWLNDTVIFIFAKQLCSVAHLVDDRSYMIVDPLFFRRIEWSSNRYEV